MSKKKDVVVQNNNNVLYIVIILLLVVIAVLAFFAGRSMGNPVAVNPANNAAVATDLKITVIDDTRCTSCGTNDIVSQLKQTPFLAAAEYEMKDFADEWIEEYIIENNITRLPAVLFSTNQIADNGAMAQYLTAIPSGEYSLQIGASFDPFAQRSERGFLMIEDKAVIEEIRSTAHVEGDADAKILWLEYSDVNCHFCQKMVDDGTVETVTEALPWVFNHAFVNFIGVGWNRTQEAAEALECIASTWSTEAYNYAFKQSLSEKRDSVTDILAYAAEKWVDTAAAQTCIDNGDSKDLVAKKYSTGQQLFGITGTPGNVILNIETGEYEIVSGAYPADTFETTINSLVN